MARPAGGHDASERQSQGVLFTGLLLFALSLNQKGTPARSWCVCHQRWISFLAFKKFFELFEKVEALCLEPGNKDDWQRSYGDQALI